MTTRATTAAGLVTSPAPSRRRAARTSMTMQPGIVLGHLPNRSTKALAAAGLHELGIRVRYIIERPYDGSGPFRAETEDWEQVAHITAARAFIKGLLFALNPPDQLADEVVTARMHWAGPVFPPGRVIAAWHFACGHPGCVVYATVRKPEQQAAGETLAHHHGWTLDERQGWLCPDHSHKG